MPAPARPGWRRGAAVHVNGRAAARVDDAALDEGAGFPGDEARVIELLHDHDREAVVELGHVDVLGCQPAIADARRPEAVRGRRRELRARQADAEAAQLVP